MGRQILEVPDVSGMTPEEAPSPDTGRVCLREEREVFDPESPVNAVVEQHPEPGITVEMGTPVDLVINRGKKCSLWLCLISAARCSGCAGKPCSPRAHRR